MRYLMRHSNSFGYLNQNRQPMSLRQLALTAGCPTDRTRDLIQELIDSGACKHDQQRGYYSPSMVAFETFKQKCAQAGRDGGGSPRLKRLSPTFKGPQPLKVVPKDGPKDELDPPPEVSPFPTPLSSSLPSSISLSPRAEFGDAPSVQPSQIRSRTATATAETFREAKIDAVAAVSRWAALNPPVGRGYALNPETGEDRQVYGLVEELAQEPLPIVRAGGSSPRHALIANVVEMLIGSRTPFKDPRWAFGCIRNKLRDWARDGVETANQSRGRSSDKPRLPAPLTGTVKAKC